MLREPFKAALVELLNRVETPFYAYDLAEVEARAAALRSAFPRARFFYAVKANPALFFLRFLRERGFSAETVSLGEVFRAYRAGFLPREVLLNGPVKPPRVLRALSAAGVPVIGLDSTADLERVARYLPGARVLLRVNPDLPVQTHDHLATGRGTSQFGFPPEAIPAAVERARERGLAVLGLHLHLGSDLSRPEDFAAGYRVVEELFEVLGPQPVVDLGGGFGLDLDLAALAPRLAPIEAKAGAIWLEPGRYLVARAGVLVTRVWGEKVTRRRYLLLDAGMTQFLRPALYGARPPVLPLYAGGAEAEYDLAGPACESTDVLARGVRLPAPREGDALAILEAGAYGASMASTYLDTPRPPGYVWDGASWLLIDEPEPYAALFARERG